MSAIYVAVDTPDLERALEIAGAVRGEAGGVKVGLEFFAAQGPAGVRRVSELGLPFLFTDCHAYSGLASFYNDLARLDRIDWPLLQSRDFKRDPEDPGKLERYQAEALVHKHVPLAALLGIVCHTDVVRAEIESKMRALGVALPVHTRPNWYF